MLPCESSPCMNGGVCVGANNAEGFTCSCPASFIGPRCEESVCNPNPCRNGATCFAFANVPFFCLCADGFTGETCEFLDTTPPTISNCPSQPIRRTAPTGTSQVAVSWTAPRATDASGIASTDVNFPPGSLFIIGTTPVRYVFTDGAGNSAVCTFDVIVTGTDTTPPTISNCPPQPIRRTAPTGTSQVAVSWTTPRATDASGIESTDVNFLPGSLFIIGTTPVRYVFTDGAGNSAVCTFDVIVTGTDPPTGSFTVTCPDDICMVPPAGMVFVQVIWNDPVVSGGVGQVSQLRGPAVNSAFYQAGTGEVVIYQFSDGANNFAEYCQQSTSPLMVQNCPGDMSHLLNQGSISVFVEWDDLVVTGDGNVRQIAGPPSSSGTFSLGDTLVEYIFQDDSGQRATCTFTVRVTQASSCDIPSCQNGGTCIPLTLTDFTCACPGCFRGDQCEDVVNACDGNQCQNGGTCQPFIGSCEQYFCLCPPCLSGIFCELQTNPCDSGSCGNGAICSPSGTGCSQFTCQCQGCFLGPFCEQEFNPCSNNPCQNGGICQPLQGSCTLYTCDCQGCFTGFNCEIPFNPCQNRPCLNGGTCRNDPTSCTGYSCDCIQCFAGFQCELAIANLCDGNPCVNGGTCVRTGESCTSFLCLCEEGFGGPLCQTVPQVVTNPCSSAPCQNGGSCLVTENGYHCICRVGYRGNNCESSIVQAVRFDACGIQGPNFCSNNGVCLNAFISISRSIIPVCDCPVGFAGHFCGVNVGNPCIPNPCRNNGQCTDFGRYFICECVQPYAGETCESLQVDRTPPDIMNCPTQTIVVRTTQTHAIVNWPEPTATDDSQFPVRLVSANAAPGALYPVGTSRRVFYNFEDLAGNTATCSFIIQVLSEN
ncbi:Neurogenic locus notch-like protein 1 [Holothuria leucospilota]|uniref:Neurogenic locus notch-like protein 1 n=1 Tax=Holothuria leucospilota TaxID=206669 RepID=A0A9Q0YR60_HOLLE|nr:Neurogenic locus notch-like protein 1 [Holothuria leucospilota]